MLLYDRRKFVMLATALTGCGFTPAYGPNGSAGDLHGSVRFEAPSNRNEFELVAQLERQLGTPKSPQYELSYNVNVREDSVGVTPEQERIRYNVVGKASFSLRDRATGALVTSGSVDTFTGYSAGVTDTTTSPPRTSSTISTLAAKRDARSRLMVALADLMVTQMIATAGDWAE